MSDKLPFRIESDIEGNFYIIQEDDGEQHVIVLEGREDVELLISALHYWLQDQPH